MLSENDLLKFSACDGMGPDELAKLHGALVWRDYAAGDFLFSEGERATTIFFLYRGSVSIQMRRDGREEQLAVLGPYSIFGELGAVLDKPRSAAARAQTDLGAGLLHRRLLLEWIEARERVAVLLVLNTLRVTASRIRRVNEKLFELARSEHVGSHVQAELADFRQKLFTSWSF